MIALRYRLGFWLFQQGCRLVEKSPTNRLEFLRFRFGLWLTAAPLWLSRELSADIRAAIAEEMVA